MPIITSNEVNPTPVAPPVVTLTVIGGNNRVDLNWNQLAGATAVRVYRRPVGQAYGAPLATMAGNVTAYADIGSATAAPTNGSSYLYKVEVDIP
jgi:hypothetical protein